MTPHADLLLRRGLLGRLGRVSLAVFGRGLFIAAGEGGLLGEAPPLLESRDMYQSRCQL